MGDFFCSFYFNKNAKFDMNPEVKTTSGFLLYNLMFLLKGCNEGSFLYNESLLKIFCVRIANLD